ncbi:MAG: GAF domain-containing protein, partial [Chthoniobacterales bacterium]
RLSGPPMSTVELAASDPELRRLLGDAIAHVGAAEGSILLLSADQKSLRFVVAQSPTADLLLTLEQPLDQGIVGRAVAARHPMIVNEVQDDDAFDPIVDSKTGVRTNSIMVVPLLRSDLALGAVTAINSASASGFAQEDLECYMELAQQVVQRLAHLEGESGDHSR